MQTRKWLEEVKKRERNFYKDCSCYERNDYDLLDRNLNVEVSDAPTSLSTGSADADSNNAVKLIVKPKFLHF